eukprot:jgi/Chrzof1/6121/Cz17g10160.t1
MSLTSYNPVNHTGKPPKEPNLGEACAVRDVHAPPTLHTEGTRVQRGMVTKIVKDRMMANEAAERMKGSVLYTTGNGYTIPS